MSFHEMREESGRRLIAVGIVSFALIVLSVILYFVFRSAPAVPGHAVNALPPVTDASPSAVSDSFFTTDLFLLKFVIFLLIAFAAFIALGTLIRMGAGSVGGGWQSLTVGEAFKKECCAMRDNNNHRWLFLLITFLVTFGIALDNPGPGLLLDALTDLPTTLFGHENTQASERQWNYLMYGKAHPARKSLFPDPDYPDDLQQPPDEKPTTILKTNWFWAYAAMALGFLTFFYTFIAFSDEVIVFFKAIFRLFKEEYDKRKGAPPAGPPKVVVETKAGEQKPSQASAAQPTVTATVSTPPADGGRSGFTLRNLVIADIIGESLGGILAKALHEAFEHFAMRHKGRNAFA